MAHPLFTEFIDVCFEGVQARAADALGIDRSMVSRICSGDRQITKDLAEKIEEVSEGRYRKAAMLWPDSEAA